MSHPDDEIGVELRPHIVDDDEEVVQYAIILFDDYSSQRVGYVTPEGPVNFIKYITHPDAVFEAVCEMLDDEPDFRRWYNSLEY